MRVITPERRGMMALCVVIAVSFYYRVAKAGLGEEFFLLPVPVYAAADTLLPAGEEAGRVVRVQRRSPPPPVELNGADSVALVKIRGIGPYYASRILRYREQLGGFHDVQQLKELRMTYLDIDTLLPHFTVDPARVRKRAMDTMSFASLLRHPYLEYEDVALIFNAKRAAGDSLSLAMLEEKRVLVPRKLKRLKPYFY
ncbi:MAG: helix-hairpin-helix domain-containing protein [Odoribacteraceae bacterium]|jgi:hypothetical protein|nr:helix-hairpin-helix domain-containing protein [Odoribacteraceae bacterium]